VLIDHRALTDEVYQAGVVIVGSGAVGLLMAVDLARAGEDVIVLEAGGDRLDRASQDLFALARWGDMPLPGLHLGRFRMLGGTTNFWGGQLVPFDTIVFDNRPWVSEASWPITLAELNPFYERVYHLLGMTSPPKDIDIWRRLKAIPPDTGDELTTFFTAWAPEPNFASLFRKELTSIPNLRVFVNAPVVSLQMDGTSTRVTSVLTRNLDGKNNRFSGRHVILANGTVEIARLLKMPLVDGRMPPWNKNPWLGTGFLDHADCCAGRIFPTDKRRFHDIFDNVYLGKLKFVPKIKLSESAQRRRQLLGIVAQFLFRSSLEEHLDNFKKLVRSMIRGQFEAGAVSMSSVRSAAAVLSVSLPMVFRYLRYHRMYNLSDRGIILHLMAEHPPVQESRIQLLTQRDALDMPVVQMDWRVHKATLETMAEFAEYLHSYFSRHKLAHLEIDPLLVSRDDSFLHSCSDSFHQMGMVRMSKTPADGVVDRNLKVFGIDNLFVAGAAVFPTSGFANPTLTAMALGLRLACRIRTRELS
jgi:hypothetical protein